MIALLILLELSRSVLLLIDLIFGVLTPLSAIFCAQLCKLQKGCTLLAAASDKVDQFLA
jgi:hypothetical protein